MKIIVDAFGGDNAPLEVIKGCKMAADEYGYDIILVGKEQEIRDVALKNNVSLQGMSIHNASDVITMEDDPTDVIKSKSESSMAVGLRLLNEGQGDAFVSAGNSGALVVGATLIVKRIRGIKRAAFAPVIPKSKGFFMLADSGANAECRPEMLEQFGIMGSIYMEEVMKVRNPRVGLVNVGIEEHKGDELRHGAYELLKNSGINFIGNLEAREVPIDGADVVVADGFTGNVMLKLYEGMALTLMGKFKEMFMKNIKTKLALAMVLPELKKMKSQIDYNEYGGAPLIGISKPVFKAHGNSKAKTIKSAIRLTSEYVKGDVVGKTSEKLASRRSEGSLVK